MAKGEALGGVVQAEGGQIMHPNDPSGPANSPEECGHYSMVKTRWGWHCHDCDTTFEYDED